ncbi:TPA: phage minor tail protein L [Pluralibacter gergoviae]|uniref:phage minor tail protein L n=1 Tax=Pluralibacter gergoviae TaxID=61647 RepID=UPI0005EC9435|nr:phage minor tail protein L [Pluralibacter gergoviae]KJM58586.1 phage minor tail protein L [Pluralibacter gergoviae]MBL3694159.1 phage minor tail protein L [Pluralibacter gergoviae]OUR04235.1 phage minor tail protein L [Pluralibacter gergoviae]HDS1149635.1 phage minor tail protein L [Pluralibacter gergoviae]
MSLNSDYQKLEPGNEIRLIEVDGTTFGVDDILRFHSHNIAHTPEEISAAGGYEVKLPAKSIWWQGMEYSAWPCQIEGIETSTSGSAAQPKLSVANLDSSITALCLAYDDLLQAKVSIHDTLAQYLDAENFPGGNPTADPTQEKLKVFYIDSKDSETNETVEFTLSSPMDLQGLMIPTRQLHSLCTWCIRNKYRSGDGCDYAGSRYFDKNNAPVDDPSQDVCNGTLRACKLRFGENNELPFGGFPGTSLIRS